LTFGGSLNNKKESPMKAARLRTSCSLATLLTLCSVASATELFVADFEVDPTANWTVNDPGLSDTLVDFFYDYSAIGVPSAPSGAGTRGLKMTANNSGNIFSGFSVSPTGQSFAGDYVLTFDLWQNYVGPLGSGGSGSTQLSTFGIGTAGDVAFWPGAPVKESVAFGVTLDGGSASDYRVYDSSAPTSHPAGSSVYSAPGGANNGSDPYYAGFGGESAPAAQLVLFPGQVGSTDSGEIAFAWREVLIDVSGGFATWFIDGLQIAQVDLMSLTLGGGNILFGHSDTNGSSSADPNDSLLNITLIDNIRVEAARNRVPEPASGALVAFGLAAMLCLRRRREPRLR
jgi:hypothetical protein